MDDSSAFTSLRSQRLSDSAVEQFVSLVKEGRLRPGQRVPSEREMVTTLGVSRSSYREAVRVLETMGLLRVVPGRGTWVCEEPVGKTGNVGNRWLAVHELDVQELLEVRHILEVQGVALAARRGTDEEFAAIERAVELIRQVADSGDAAAMVDADTAFHQALAECAHNQALSVAVAELYQRLSDTRLAMIEIPGRLRRAPVEHGKIAAAVRSRNPEAAKRVMAKHVQGVEKEVAAAIAAGRLRRNGVATSDSQPVIEREGVRRKRG